MDTEIKVKLVDKTDEEPPKDYASYEAEVIYDKETGKILGYREHGSNSGKTTPPVDNSES